MDAELTSFEKNTKMLAEKENPYASTCPNRHLWNEGYLAGMEAAKNISSNLAMTCSCGKPCRIPLCKECFNRGLDNQK